MKSILKAGFLVALVIMLACNSNKNNETESSEIIVKDSMGTTTTPVTDHVDSATAAKVSDSGTTGLQVATKSYENDKGGKLKATYTNNNDLSVVSLEIAGESPIKLMQTETGAKGAVYSNGKITWQAGDENAILTRDGKHTKYMVKK